MALNIAMTNHSRAMRSVLTFGTMRARVAGTAFAHAVVGSAFPVILTFTPLRAVNAVITVVARLTTIGARPSGIALALTCQIERNRLHDEPTSRQRPGVIRTGYMMTIGSVFTVAPFRAILSVRLQRARMFAHRAYVTRPTFEIARNVVARFVLVCERHVSIIVVRMRR